MISFENAKAKRVAKTAWEIVNASSIDSPVVRHRISRGGYHIDIVTTNGSNLLITATGSSEQIKTLLCAKLNQDINTFEVYVFCDGDWVSTVNNALETLQENRNLARQMGFEAFARVKAVEGFSIVKGEISDRHAKV